MSEVRTSEACPVPRRKSSLSEPRGRLVELMQRLGFGRVERLPVEAGEPVLDPLPRTLRELKFGGENGPRPETMVEDFQLKAQVVELFRCLDELQDGVVEILDIKHGLPFRMIVESAA